jgi:hypothetical protein
MLIVLRTASSATRLNYANCSRWVCTNFMLQANNTFCGVISWQVVSRERHEAKSTLKPQYEPQSWIRKQFIWISNAEVVSWSIHVTLAYYFSLTNNKTAHHAGGKCKLAGTRFATQSLFCRRLINDAWGSGGGEAEGIIRFEPTEWEPARLSNSILLPLKGEIASRCRAFFSHGAPKFLSVRTREWCAVRKQRREIVHLNASEKLIGLTRVTCQPAPHLNIIGWISAHPLRIPDVQVGVR